MITGVRVPLRLKAQAYEGRSDGADRLARELEFAYTSKTLKQRSLLLGLPFAILEFRARLEIK